MPFPKSVYPVKDLRVLLHSGSGREIKDIILIDNQVQNFILQQYNGIPIKDFNGDLNDKVLKSLYKYLL